MGRYEKVYVIVNKLDPEPEVFANRDAAEWFIGQQDGSYAETLRIARVDIQEEARW